MNIEYGEFPPPGRFAFQPLIRDAQNTIAHLALPPPLNVMNEDRSASQTACPGNRNLSPRTRSTVTARTIDEYVVPGAVDQRRNLWDRAPDACLRGKVEKQDGSCSGSQINKAKIVLHEGSALVGTSPP